MSTQEKREEMTLEELAPGESGVILQVGNENGPVKRRLVDMGLTPGTEVTVRKLAPFGDPLELNLRGYELSLRKADAAQIRMAVGAEAERRSRVRRQRIGMVQHIPDEETLRRMEEAVADATESAYAHLHTLRNWEAVRPWLMRITVNACHKMLRRRKRETPSGDETLFDRPIKPSDATEIWSLVEQLDALYSVPLTMFYADGMKLEEIAAALHVPKGTVSARMTRGRQKLKTWMEEEL